MTTNGYLMNERKCPMQETTITRARSSTIQFFKLSIFYDTTVAHCDDGLSSYSLSILLNCPNAAKKSAVFFHFFFFVAAPYF